MFQYFIVWFVIGIVVGFVGGKVLKKKPCGYLRVDHSDPNDPPLLFLELKTDFDYVKRQQEVTFKVEIEDFVPHN